MKLVYFPDTDTLEVVFGEEGPVEATYDGRGPEPGDVECVLVHWQEGRLAGLTIEHASSRAPAVWNVPQLRRLAAAVARETGRAVTQVEIDEGDQVVYVQRQADEGPTSLHVSDAAVRAYNALVRGETTTAAEGIGSPRAS